MLLRAISEVYRPTDLQVVVERPVGESPPITPDEQFETRAREIIAEQLDRRDTQLRTAAEVASKNKARLPEPSREARRAAVEEGRRWMAGRWTGWRLAWRLVELVGMTESALEFLGRVAGGDDPD